MDPATLAAFATAILIPLSPYLVKAGEEFAKQVGQELATKATNLTKTIFTKSEEVNKRPQVQQVINTLDMNLDAQAKLKEFITQHAKTDQAFAQALADEVNDIRVLLLNCLQTRFLTQDLKELYFRLGIGWNQLAGTGATDREKAMALIEEMWVTEKIPNLIKSMQQVRRNI